MAGHVSGVWRVEGTLEFNFYIIGMCVVDEVMGAMRKNLGKMYKMGK